MWKRHQVDIYEPATTLDNRGQVTGSDTRVMRDVPASITQVSGLELIRARKLMADATHTVEINADPAITITPRHYLLFGTRQLNIGATVDEENTGVELTLICQEEV